MKLYPENYNVSVDVLFTDLNGQAVTPSAVNAVLYDGEDQEIVDFGSLPFDAGDTHKEIVIPAAFNVLGEGELSASRILRVELVTAAGSVRRAHSYLIEGQFRLEIMINSFMSMEAAEMLARDMPNISGWEAASEDKRYAALIEAFNSLVRIPMKFKTTAEFVAYDELGYERASNSEETIILRSAWPTITRDEFMSWPAHFRKALRKAQFAEANELLEGDAITRRHRAGIISETIGESSITLRSGQIDYGLSRQALSYLSGHIYYDYRIARA